MKIKLLIILSITVINLSAQQSGEVRTLFGKSNQHLGYYVTPFLQSGKIAGSTAVSPGVGAGITINQKVSIDIRYKFIITENTPSGESDTRLYLDGQWIGLRGEYSLIPESAIHVSFPVEVGLGEVELDLKDAYESDQVMVPTEDAWYAYLEPGVAFEINLWKYIKINISAGYRLASNMTFRSMTEKDMMGFTYSGAIKIGLF